MIKISYRFNFPETKENPIIYNIGIDEKTGKYLPLEKADPAADRWSALDFHQCENCTMKKEGHPICPMAKGIFDLVYFFKDSVSFKKSQVVVDTVQRTYSKNCSVQEGLFSIFGLIMAISGCPHMEFLRPLARYHLPFATFEETLYRTASNHLLKEYFEKNKVVSLDGLAKLYQEVETVNHGMIARIGQVAKADCDKNAVVILNTFAQLIEMEVSSDFSSLKDFFKK